MELAGRADLPTLQFEVHDIVSLCDEPHAVADLDRVHATGGADARGEDFFLRAFIKMYQKVPIAPLRADCRA